MRITTRGRYGLKAMESLAGEYFGGKHVSLKSIAEAQGISENYLEQIISPLKKAGIVSSARGAAGGYMLTRTPDEITVGEVLRVLEGNLAMADCLHDSDATCGKNECGSCGTKAVFTKLFDKVNEVVDSITLLDLANID